MNSFRRDSLYWKGSIVSAGIRKPRSMDYEANSLPLSWWMGIKVAYIKYKIRCLQINQVYAIVTKWRIVNNFEKKCCVKTAATLTLASTQCHVSLIKMCQECYNRRDPECSKKIFFSSENELKFCDVMLLLLKIDEAYYIIK